MVREPALFGATARTATGRAAGPTVVVREPAQSGVVSRTKAGARSGRGALREVVINHFEYIRRTFDDVVVGESNQAVSGAGQPRAPFGIGAPVGTGAVELVTVELDH